jgi:hypothetical protein
MERLLSKVPEQEKHLKKDLFDLFFSSCYNKIKGEENEKYTKK